MVKSLASASSATRAYSIFKVRSFNLKGLSTCQVFRPSQPGGIRTPMKPSRIGFSTYLAVLCIPFPSLTRYFCFKVFRFFLTPLTFQHLYYITSFSICQALFPTFFIFSFQSIKFKINLNRCTRLPNLYCSSLSRGFLSQSTYLL